MVNGSGFWHLKLVELLLGDGVQNVTGVGGGGQLLGPLEPVLQVGAVGHELMPQEPTPLQPPTGWREGEREREREREEKRIEERRGEKKERDIGLKLVY